MRRGALRKGEKREESRGGGKAGLRRKGHLQPKGSADAIRIISSGVIANITSLQGNP